MELPQLFALLTAFLTWGAFIGVSKYYFRHARRRNAAKTLLVVSAGVCTLAQLVTVVLAKPPSEWWSWLGSAGFVPAHILYWWALSTHGKSRPAFVCVPVVPSAFAKTGPYGIVRHPIYAAYLLAWLAGPIASGQLWLLLTTLWMWLLYYRAARQEEAYFSATSFAPAYREYRKHTGMFLPRLI